MGRLILGGIIAVIVMIALVGSISHGFLSRLPYLSRRGLVGLLGVLCVVLALGWLYISGDLEYFVWDYQAPKRPADERAFVDRVEEARDLWSSTADHAAQAALCSRQTAEIAGLAPSVANWTGTVSTTYLIGRQVVLVVRIGRSVLARTPYNVSEDGPFIEQGTPASDHVAGLTTGDAVTFSGDFVIDPKHCLFGTGSSAPSDQTELLFKFNAIGPG